jgi:hypothetical protein
MSKKSPIAWGKHDTLVLGGLLAFSILLRLPHLLYPYVINIDAIKYIKAAQLVSQEGLWQALRLSKDSIFPILISLIFPLTEDPVSAARSLPLIFGVLTLIPLYLLSRDLIGRAPAWIPCLLYCISPSIFGISMDVVREPLFWFIFALFLWTLLGALRKQTLPRYLAAGALAVLGMTIRLNGLVLIPVSMGLAIYAGFYYRQYLKGLFNAMGILLPAAIVALVMTAATSGRQVTIFEGLNSYYRQAKTSILDQDRLDLKAQPEISRSHSKHTRRFWAIALDHRHAVLVLHLLDHWIRAAHPLLFILTILGLSRKGTWNEPKWHLLAVLMVVWLVMGYIRITGAFAISKRHLIPLVMVGYLYAAVGISAVTTYCSKRWPKFSQRTMTIFLLLLTCLATVPKLLEPIRHDKLTRRDAGEWILSLGAANTVIVTNCPRVGFYAGGHQVSWSTLQKEPQDRTVFITQRFAGKHKFGLKTRLRGPLKASHRDNLFLAHVQRDDEVLLEGKLKRLIMKKWEFVRHTEFQRGTDTVRIYHFKRR